MFGFLKDILIIFLGLIFHSAVFWVPILLLVIFRKIWLSYNRKKAIRKFKWTMLHIKLPQEVHKTPLAMELIFNNLGGVGPNWTWWFKGGATQWYSLEIASIEGNIYFFMRVPTASVDILKPAIYAHYPGVEIAEVDDYTKHIEQWHKDGTWDIWSSEYKLTKDDVYPIKTYIDYGLDRSGKAEEQIDPMATVLSHMGSMGPGEQMWLQILVTKPAKRFKSKKFVKEDWKKEAEKEIEKIKEEHSREVEIDGKKVKKFSAISMTVIEKEKLEALERSLNKNAFDVGMRAVYAYKKDKFRLPVLMGAMSMFKSFDSDVLNGFKTTNTTFFAAGKDIANMRLNSKKKELFYAYVDRCFFYHPNKRKPFVLTTEELATIFHFPSTTIETPGVDRVQAKKSSPPSNLPID